MSHQLTYKATAAALSHQQSGHNLRTQSSSSPSPYRPRSNNSSKAQLPLTEQTLYKNKEGAQQQLEGGATRNQSSKQLISPKSGARIKFKEPDQAAAQVDRVQLANTGAKEGVTSPRSGRSSKSLTKPRQSNKQLSFNQQNNEEVPLSPKSQSSSNQQHAQMIQAQQQRKSFYANKEKYEGFLQDEGAVSEDKTSSKMQNKFEMIKAILNKSNNQRSDHDLDKLVPLIKTIEFFYQRDIKDSDFSEIVQCLQYEFMEQGKDVFEYNSMGDKFYIILKGTVSVMIPNPDHKDFKRKFEEFQKHRQIIEQGKNTLNSLQQTKDEHQSFMAGHNQRGVVPQSQSPNSHHIHHHHLAKLNSSHLNSDLQPLEIIQRKHQSLIHPHLSSNNNLPYHHQLQVPPVNSSANKLMAALQAGLNNKIRSLGGGGLCLNNTGLTVGGASLTGSINGSIRGYNANESLGSTQHGGEGGASAANQKISQFSPGQGQGKRKLLQSKGKTMNTTAVAKKGLGGFKVEVQEMDYQDSGNGLVDPENREESEDEVSEEELEDGVAASVGNQYESGQGSVVQSTQRDIPPEAIVAQNAQARPSLKTIVSKISFTKRMIRESQNYMKHSKKSRHQELPLFIEAVQLKAGKSFGELALIKNKPRAATIKCIEDCHFAVMSQADYNKVLNKIEQKNMTRIVEFLHELPFFKVWTRTALSKLYYSFEQRNLQRNQVLFRENQEADTVYIVQAGEFEVTKRFKREQEKEVDIQRLLNQKKSILTQAPIAPNGSQNGVKGQITRQETNVYEGNLEGQGETNLPGGKKAGSTKTKQEKMFKSGYNSTIQIASRQRNVETFKIAILGAGQMFGEDDLIHEREYTTTVICRSNVGQVFAIKATEFLRRLKSNEECWRVILQQVQLKDQLMKNRLSKIDYVFHKEVRKSGADGKGGGGQSGKDEPRKQKYPSILQKYQIKATQDKLEDFRDTIKEIVSNGNSPNQADHQQRHRSEFVTHSEHPNRRQGFDSSQRSTSPPVNNSLSKYTTLFSQTYDNRVQHHQQSQQQQQQLNGRFNQQKTSQVNQVYTHTHPSMSPPFRIQEQSRSLFGQKQNHTAIFLSDLDKKNSLAAKLHTDNMLTLRSNFNSLMPDDKATTEFKAQPQPQLINPYANQSFQEHNNLQQQNFSFTHSVQFEKSEAKIEEGLQDYEYSPLTQTRAKGLPQNLLSQYVKSIPANISAPDQKHTEHHSQSLPRHHHQHHYQQHVLQSLVPKTAVPSSYIRIGTVNSKLNSRSFNQYNHNQTHYGDFKISLQKGEDGGLQQKDLELQRSLNQYDSLNHLSIDKHSPRMPMQSHLPTRYGSIQKAQNAYGGSLNNRSYCVDTQPSSKMFSTTYEKQKSYMSVAHTLKPSTGRIGGRRNIKSLIQTQYKQLNQAPPLLLMNVQNQTPYLTPQQPSKNMSVTNATIAHATSQSQHLHLGQPQYPVQSSNNIANQAIYQKSLFLMSSNGGGGYQNQTNLSQLQHQNLSAQARRGQQRGEGEMIGQFQPDEQSQINHYQSRAFTAAVGVRAGASKTQNN